MTICLKGSPPVRIRIHFIGNSRQADGQKDAWELHKWKFQAKTIRRDLDLVSLFKSNESKENTLFSYPTWRLAHYQMACKLFCPHRGSVVAFFSDNFYIYFCLILFFVFANTRLRCKAELMSAISYTLCAMDAINLLISRTRRGRTPFMGPTWTDLELAKANHCVVSCRVASS